MKAMDAYPYNLEETLESINYSLSYNDSNPFSYILLGRFYVEQFYNFKEAISCFEKALWFLILLPLQYLYRNHLPT